jgi:hypothetical protein
MSIIGRPVAVIGNPVGALPLKVLGVLITPLVPNCTVGALPVAVAGTLVSPHSKHPAAFMIPTQVRVLARGLPLVRVLDFASCGHICLPGPNVRVLCF